MKTELMTIPGKGICIVISGINPNDFVFGGRYPFVGAGIFSDVMIIAEEIRRGRKIAAIKEIRSQTGWGLKEAKEYIDRYVEGWDNQNSYSCNVYAERFLQAHMPDDLLDEDEFKV